ncbi:nuclear transport factor 2 family protein [Spirosoma areae]
MKSLHDCVATLTELIRQGQTIEAMERFYADDILMQENKTPPRIGKVACLAHERRMLAGVTDMQASLVNQAINEEAGVVFSEWQYAFTDLTGQQFLLTEVAVQHWRNELIYKETFYYNKILTVP